MGGREEGLCLGIMKAPVGVEDRWIEKEGFCIKVHCRRRVSEFDPRRGKMPGMRIGPERTTVMRTSGPKGAALEVRQIAEGGA